MIKLKLKFDGKESQEFSLDKKELLKDVVAKTLDGVPMGDLKPGDAFNVVVNGLLVEEKFWEIVEALPSDDILITPKIKGGEFGQIFKQIVIIAAIAVTAYFTAGTSMAYWAPALAGMAAGLVMNALIPPLVPSLGGEFGGSGPESSQMYTVSGQSNERKPYASVPKVYGTHRMFPNLAANPYVELGVDQATGETIQYLCAIYDFGLGSPVVTELKIGDTELNDTNFTDFQYRFVDPAKPDSGTDAFDTRLNKTFTIYKGDRQVTALSIALNDTNDMAVQNTAPNPKNYLQEIVLDLVAPRGLFGYSSGGTLGSRQIALDVQFALVGTSNWRAYNDPDYCDSWSSIGGQDLTDFTKPLVGLLPTHALFDNYYYYGYQNSGSGYNTDSSTAEIYVRAGQRKLLVPKPSPSDNWQWNVGTKVVLNSAYLGNIQSVTDLSPTYPDWVELILDRDISFPPSFGVPSSKIGTVQGSSVYTYSDGVKTVTYTWTSLSITGTITGSRHTLARANILGDKTTPVYTNIRFKPKTPGQYKVRIIRTGTSGDFTQQVGDALTWGALTTNFDNTPIKSEKRHVFMELKIRATDQLNGQVQNLSGVATQPVLVYDYDTSSWGRQITSNPAWIFCDLLCGEVNKKSVPYSRLHLPSILEWADYCDTVPTPPPGDTYKEPRFQANFILDYDSTLQQVLQQIGSMSQAGLNIIDGKYGVLLDRTKTTPVQIFTPRNSKDFSSVRGYTVQPNAVKVTYIDPNLAWDTAEAICYDNGYDEDSAETFDELTAFATTNYEQAWRYGRYMMAQNRLRQETISLTVDFENLVCTRGDYVQITQDVMQVGGRPARVKSVAGNVVVIDDGLDIGDGISYGYTFRSSTGEIKTSTLTPLSARSFELDGDLPDAGDLIIIGEVGKLVLDCIVKAINPNDDLSAQLTLVERANEIFDAESTSELPVYDPQVSQTSDPSFKPPRAVTNLTLGDVTWQCADTQSGYEYYAEIVWDIPIGSIYTFFEVWYNDGSGYKSVATTTAKYWKQVLTQSRLGQNMGLKVVAVSASGKKLELVAMPEVRFDTSIKSTPPSNVPGFGISITQQVLQLAWQPIDDCDVFRYEIRYSPEVNDVWEASVPLQIVDRNVNSLSVQARTGAYFIKAVDFAGNKSETASIVITTIPNLFDLNVIEEVNDAPINFSGIKESTELLGEAVILSERVHGDVDTMEFYSDGYYVCSELVDLGEIYSARLQSLIRADGYRYGELMSSWEHLSDVEHLGSAGTDDWNITAEYRATTEILSMASWEHLSDVEHLNEGLGQGFTEWRPIPTIGDATGRVFQFRIHLQSLTPNVTPRLFDGLIKIDMPDRLETFEDLVSSDTDPILVSYTRAFAGPEPSPNIQISVQDGEAGDYWVFENRNLEGFQIRFYDNTGTQVVRTFDVAVKGYGRRHVVTI